MKFRHKKFILYSTGVFVLMLLIALIAKTFCYAWDLYILIAFGVAILFLTILITYRSVFDYSKQSKSDIIAIMDGWNQFYNTNNLHLNLPLLTSFTITPDFAFHIADIIKTKQPKVITELGCGRSTLIAAGLMQKLGIDGKIISIDSDAQYLEQCKQFALANGLEKYIEFVHAPLKQIIIQGKNYIWFDATRIPETPFDLLIVDGPPEVKGVLSRYPALPIMLSKANASAIILADDAGRSDMIATAEKWKIEFPQLQITYVSLMRGALIIQLQSA